MNVLYGLAFTYLLILGLIKYPAVQTILTAISIACVIGLVALVIREPLAKFIKWVEKV